MEPPDTLVRCLNCGYTAAYRGDEDVDAVQVDKSYVKSLCRRQVWWKPNLTAKSKKEAIRELGLVMNAGER